MTTAPLRQQPAMRVPGVGRALAVTLVVGVSAAVLALAVAGRPQLVGALAGAGLVAVFFCFGMLNTALAAAFAPRTALVVAMTTYTVQVVGLGLLLVALARSGLTDDTLDVRWLGGTVIVGALAWSAALVVGALRSPIDVMPGEVGAR
jgi:ATP synthase protein I